MAKIGCNCGQLECPKRRTMKIPTLTSGEVTVITEDNEVNVLFGYRFNMFDFVEGEYRKVRRAIDLANFGEFMETVIPTEEFIKKCRESRKEGFKELAHQDFREGVKIGTRYFNVSLSCHGDSDLGMVNIYSNTNCNDESTIIKGEGNHEVIFWYSTVNEK